ncbi:tyrosine-type recombinase/integrase [Streptomyces sp. ERV7]|uniref:tyrosine-type recombinase/integrase n=1 Tax=Streptomyces sp. ERV7 TaxID=1322334 RepID=UPI000AEE992D|nr:tyrosine-type recombinase/integrase [Streptomyces sp. ERV7]
MRSSGAGSAERLRSGRYRASYLHPATAERHYAPHTFATKAEAQAWNRQHLAAIDRGDWFDHSQGDVLLSDYLTLWLDTNPRITKDSTRELNRDEAGRWILRELGDPAGPGGSVELGAMTLRQIDPATVRKWYDAMRKAVRASAVARAEAVKPREHPARWWARETGRPVKSSGRLSPQILNAWAEAGSPKPPAPEAKPNAGAEVTARVYRTLHALLAAAVTDELIKDNPCKITGAGQAPQVDRAPVSAEEVTALAQNYPERYRAAVWFAVFTALRPGQVFALRRKDVNLDKRLVHVARAVGKVHGRKGLHFDTPKTTGTDRWKRIPEELAVILARHMKEHTGHGPESLLFTTTHGNILASSHRSTFFDRARRKINRPDLRWYDLRSASAMFMYEQGATRTDVKRHLNHKTDAAAARYERTSEERRRSLMDGFGATFGLTPATKAPGPDDGAGSGKVIPLHERPASKNRTA